MRKLPPFATVPLAPGVEDTALVCSVHLSRSQAFLSPWRRLEGSSGNVIFIVIIIIVIIKHGGTHLLPQHWRAGGRRIRISRPA